MTMPPVPGDQPTYVDPVTGQPLYVDPTTGSLTYADPTAAAGMPGMPPGMPGMPPMVPTAAYPPPPGGYPPPAGYPTFPGAPGYAYMPPPMPRTSGLALASMIVSLSGIPLLLCYGFGGLLGLVGAIMGHVAQRQMRTNLESGEGMAKTGIIAGWILVGISVIIVGIIVWLAVRVSQTPDDYYNN